MIRLKCAAVWISSICRNGASRQNRSAKTISDGIWSIGEPVRSRTARRQVNPSHYAGLTRAPASHRALFGCPRRLSLLSPAGEKSASALRISSFAPAVVSWVLPVSPSPLFVRFATDHSHFDYARQAHRAAPGGKLTEVQHRVRGDEMQQHVSQRGEFGSEKPARLRT